MRIKISLPVSSPLSPNERLTQTPPRAELANAERCGKGVNMKSITIAEMHERTEQVLQQMSEEDGFVITTQGQPVAILRPAQERM